MHLLNPEISTFSSKFMVAVSSKLTHSNCCCGWQPSVPAENNVVIVQETCVEPTGCLVVYAPVDLSVMNAVTSGEESVATVPILPSGFVVSGDGSWDPPVGGGSYSGGSILTVAFQILACSPIAIRRLNMESVACVNNLITTTLHKIKLALNC